MKVDVLMPQLGESVTEGTIVKWWKKPGDFVKKDETLLEISTDKVDTEIPSPFEGTLVEILAKENETVEVGRVIARIETEAAEAETAPVSPPEPEPEKKEAPPAEPAPPAPPTAEPKPATGGQVVDILMPRLGESVTEGTIVKWWKKPGDFVKKDETLLEISTDKVDTEIPSPYEGVLKEILVSENETVAVDAVIARMELGAGGAVEAPAAPQTEAVATAAQAPPPSAPAAEPPPAREGKRGRFYSPLVLSIARKEGISMEELERIPGTGLGGRVTKKDILKYIEEKKAAVAPPVTRPAAAPPPPSTPPAAAAPAPEDLTRKYAGKRVEIIPMDAIRKKIAEHMVKSKATSPHVYSVSECDFTNVLEIVRKHRPRWEREEGFKLTINPFILYAVTKALQDFPRMNSSVEGENIVVKKYINLGMAVATDRGLIVPVLKNAEEKSFRGIARGAYDLAIRARDKKLTLDDVQDSTFSVTNYGVFGNIFGLPIINQPNVGIIGVGAVKKRPVVVETPQGDAIVIRSIGFLTLTYDHRIIDGDYGGQFLQRVVHYLETVTEDVL
ncbi:MAG: 2-oxoglutarate dehydrogenase, E2 component, dihydrolipoamide succinyltransferase [Calditrichaeota bacterium]|nr:2-oxoglutarate dehydrogenase, E2 component, dihydrolipoamide succinyltransferase [Calditrichota bacterium]